MSKQKRWIIEGSNREIECSTPWGALGIYLKRGRHGLSQNWKFTKQPDGWTIAINPDGNPERRIFKLKEIT